MEPLFKDIGKAFLNARKEKNLTIEIVSKKTHIHPRILRNIEEGIPDPKLSEIYMRSFIKKYAEFLGISNNQHIKQFSSAPRKEQADIYVRPEPKAEMRREIPKEPKREIRKEPQKAKADKAQEDEKRKELYDYFVNQVAPIIVSAIGIIVIGALLVMGISSVGRFINKGTRKSAKTASKSAAALKAPAKKESADKQSKLKSAAAPATAAADKQAPIFTDLTVEIKANKNVWVRLDKDQTTAFTGVLGTGTTEKWTAEKIIVMRVGKLEYLEFTVGGKYLGKIGDGVQNVIIDKYGIKVGGKKVNIPN